MKRCRAALRSVIAIFFCVSVGRAETNDTRIQSIHYESGRPTTIRLAPGALVVVMLPPDEHIRSIRLNDPSAFQINVAVAGDSFSLRQIRPLQQANMEVETDQRKYEFALAVSDDLKIPYLIRVHADDNQATKHRSPTTEPRLEGELTSYRLSGDRSLRPQSINDDGYRTFITWAPDQLIPAVFSVNRLGNEAMVDGYMRDKVFTIDHVHQQLIFRIDSAVATARRLPRKGKK